MVHPAERSRRGMGFRQRAAAVLIICIGLGSVHAKDGDSSKPSRSGGAGHALLLSDHAPVLKSLQNVASDAFTFEAWVRTTDFCHRGGIMSYALDSTQTNPRLRDTDYNHFVVFDAFNVIACHDFEYLDLFPDPDKASCMSAWNRSYTASFLSDNSEWHHMAVTWTRQDNGRMRIFKDGLMMSEIASAKTSPLQAGGAFMLGGEQDCYGGCTNAGQAFYGLMDEVRLWRSERSKEDILRFMRVSGGDELMAQRQDMIAYWDFNEPDDDSNGAKTQVHQVAKDISGHGNDLPLVTPPQRKDLVIDKSGSRLETGGLEFTNNYAFNPSMVNMPRDDFTVEFWAKTPAYTDRTSGNSFQSFFSYATHTEKDSTFLGGVSDSVFTDDAIRIEKYYDEFRKKPDLKGLDIQTRGSITLHINSNRDGNGRHYENWLDYAVQWVDDDWHHVAVTWEGHTGAASLYFDGKEITPFWRASGGRVNQQYPAQGGVDKHVAAGTARFDHGSLVLGQNQECFGACFSPSQSLDGSMAALRVWNRVRTQEEISADMYKEQPSDGTGLAALYTFKSSDISKATNGKESVREARGSQDNKLELWGDAPRYEYSTVPLMRPDGGKPVSNPKAGTRGHALSLNDKQALILNNFKDWPSSAITVEFWMWSVDKCRRGVPVSYATGGYEKADNSFLILNYNDWGISIMEDEGRIGDHTAGIAATDGSWHHIAVTWSSHDGLATLYDNGHKLWSVVRSQGRTMPTGGTLLIGREQDCEGGCFDSAPGASGKLDPIMSQEYGSQDFFGVIDELRIWRTVRNEDQIKQGMETALQRIGQDPAGSAGSSGGVAKDDQDLVAYWTFDEGKGYIVHDVTGRGHDLYLTNEPQWEVVRWLTECGNGIVEGEEQCDDGNQESGDGCSPVCKIEQGWKCTGENPSECWPCTDPKDCRSSGSHHSDAFDNEDDGGPPSRGGQSSDKSGHTGLIVTAVICSVIIIGFLGVGLLYRQALLEAFPGVEDGMRSLGDRLRGCQRSSLYQGLGSLDPEENLEIGPEFVGATQHPQGPYEPLRGPRNGY